jgi:BD-FAE
MQRTSQNSQVINSLSQHSHKRSTAGKIRTKPAKINALLTALLCFFSMISSNLYAVVAAAATPPVLTDDFEGSNTQYTWDTTGNWFSSSGVFNQVQMDKLYKAVIGDISWDDYTFSFDMLTTNNLDSTKSHMVARGDFRVTDNQNLYFVRLRKDGVLQLQSLKDGAKTIIASANTALSPLDNHNYLVEASGSSIKVSVDGELLIDAIDSDHANGMIGLATNKAAAAFDNVIVDLEVATPPPPADGAYYGYIYDATEITAHNGVVYATKNGQYGTPEDLKMNVYVSPNSDVTSAPLIVLVHGGGFKSGDENKDRFPLWATDYARMGFVGASITYRKANPLQDDTPFKATWDVEDAIRYLKVNAETYGIDSNKIIVIGSSAGGFATHGLNVGLNSSQVGVDLERAFPNTSSKVNGAITTGAAMVGNSNYDGLWMYDSADSPMLLLHNEVQDSETGVTWSQVLDLVDTMNAYGITTSAVPTTDSHTSPIGPYTRYFNDHIHPFVLEHLGFDPL